MQDVMQRRSRAGRFVTLALGLGVTMLLALAACAPPPEVPVIPTPTQVALFPTVTPSATRVVETSMPQTDTVTVTAVTTATTVAAQTEVVTDTAVTTATTVAAETEVVTDTAVTTDTTIAAETEAVTVTAVAAQTDVMTATEAMTVTETVTDTGAGDLPISGAAAMTHAVEITSADTISGAAAIPGVDLPNAATIRRSSEGAQVAADAALAFLQPTDNALVPLNFTVAISHTGLPIATTGADEGTLGQIYLLVDSDFVPAGEAAPDNNLHIPLVDGATSVELGQTPGSHVLRLQYIDAEQGALESKQLGDEIVVNVDEAAAPTAVRIVTPTDGAIVPPTFDVVMAASGLSVAPAGSTLEGAGHFHIILDEPFIAPGEIIPKNASYLHFGQGQLQGSVSLPVGDHLLRLQFADSEHRALDGSQYRAEVRVRVEEDAPDSQVIFVKPADGATVTAPFSVVWAATGLIIEQAGQSIRPEAGHLHLLINEDFVAGGEPIPADETHLHFGRGQTSTELTLPAGEYTLRLQMANGGHLAQDGAQYQDELQVTVR